jgi:hypothetical protein
MSVQIEVRSDEASGTVTLSSYASLFEPVTYKIGGGKYAYTEKVKPGAFSATLAAQPDVVFRLEHSQLPLARTSAGNLRLTQDQRGLHYEAVLRLDDPDVRALIPKVQAGNLRESSFAFKVPEGGDAWNTSRTERTMHTLDLDRGDVSLVTFGASKETGRYTTLRSEGSAQERRAWAEMVSHSGWCGPGAAEIRASWSNQHGRSCTDCGGDGKCKSCDGQGWIPDGSEDGDEANSQRFGLVMPKSRLGEFERELREHKARMGTAA